VEPSSGGASRARRGRCDRDSLRRTTTTPNVGDNHQGEGASHGRSGECNSPSQPVSTRLLLIIAALVNSIVFIFQIISLAFFSKIRYFSLALSVSNPQKSGKVL
jgi:hypothetical protein